MHGVMQARRNIKGEMAQQMLTVHKDNELFRQFEVSPQLITIWRFLSHTLANEPGLEEKSSPVRPLLPQRAQRPGE